MSLTLVTGTISLTRERKDISVANDNVTTYTSTEFRIGNRPASFKAGVNLAPGDQVRAAGKDGAELDVLALANDTTSVQYTAPCPPLWIIASMLLLPFIGMGLGLRGEQFIGGMLFLMGIATFPLGFVMLWKRSRVLAAVRLLSSAKPS
jgi:hypothetical protein